jgi:two-component system, NarL family, response regulator NreC
MRLVLCDDHRMMRDGLRIILENAGLEVVGEAADGREAVRLAEALAPDIVVMDIVMPELNGVDATRAIVARCPSVKVIGLSMTAEPRYVETLLAAGASGYLLKSSAADELIEAVQAVAAGQPYISPNVTAVADAPQSSRAQSSMARAGAAASAAPASSRLRRALSAREREVLQLLAEGYSSKEIAARLQVATTTVESHRRQITDKLKLRTIAELTKYAIREGLTPLE